MSILQATARTTCNVGQICLLGAHATPSHTPHHHYHNIFHACTNLHPTACGRRASPRQMVLWLNVCVCEEKHAHLQKCDLGALHAREHGGLQQPSPC